MASNILSIGQSALTAAQVGLATTGHNIANAATPGYSRQVVVQSASTAQNFGYGYVGQGAEISSVTRVYNEILARQVINSQSASSATSSYSAQINNINNMLSNENAGLSPAMSEFFSSLQGLAANPSDTATRQTMLSSSQALVNRFNSLDSRLNEIRESVNTQIGSQVADINAYAGQISKLNDIIEQAVNTTGNPPNDLLDQRDQLVSELSKVIKTTVIEQNPGSYNVFVGNGLPLVVGKDTYTLNTQASPTDPTRLEIAYQSASKNTILGASSLAGGSLGGLVQFRNESLDPIQNQLGQIAVSLAGSFNAQHAQGLDLNGIPGGALFSIPDPLVNANSNNTGNGELQSSIVDPNAVTSSNYRVQYDGSNYKITRVSDQSVQTFSSLPQTVDGISIAQTSGTINAGDDFMIRPTQNAAVSLKLAITDVNKLAVGAPAVSGTLNSSNTGSGAIDSVKVNSAYAGSPLTSPLNFTYNSGSPNTLSLSPSTQPVTVSYNGISTTYPPGTPITYTSGAEISVGNISVTLSGTPTNGDQFSVAATSSNGPGDNRNGLLLGNLQNIGQVANLGNNSKVSFSSAFSQMVSNVGSKTRELTVTGQAEAVALEQAQTALQSETGVNLDEEATNLIRYQQAYQAAGKMMQIASDLFNVLLNLG
jgi:flagellar hook-associated protein 1